MQFLGYQKLNFRAKQIGVSPKLGTSHRRGVATTTKPVEQDQLEKLCALRVLEVKNYYQALNVVHWAQMQTYYENLLAQQTMQLRKLSNENSHLRRVNIKTKRDYESRMEELNK